MIGWIYSDPESVDFWTGVMRDEQKILEANKTVVDTSNRFRVVSDVVRVTNVEAVRASPREKKNSSPSKKFQHNSGFLDGFWTLWDDSGAGGRR